MGGTNVMMKVITVGSEGLTMLRASKEYNRVVVLPEGDGWSLKQAEERWYRAPVALLWQPISLETFLLCSW